MEDNSYEQLKNTGYLSEIEGLEASVAVAKSRAEANFITLSSRVDSIFGKQAHHEAGELLLTAEDDGLDTLMTDTTELFANYKSLGRIPAATSEKSHSKAIDSEHDLQKLFWGEPTTFEKYRELFGRVPKTIGSFAVKAFRALENRLTPTPLYEEAAMDTLVALPARRPATLAERIYSYEKKHPQRAALTRAAAWIAITATLSVGSGYAAHNLAEADTSNYPYYAQVVDMSELEQEASLPTLPILTTTTSTTVLPDVIPSTATTTVAPTETASAPPIIKPVVKTALSDADCSVEYVKDAPIDRVVYSANYLMENHRLTTLGSSMLVGNFVQETGDLGPSAVGDGGLARGLGQWHGSRQAGMPSTLEGQMDFAIETEMPRSGNEELVDLLRDNNATVEEIEHALYHWEIYGVKGNRTGYGLIINDYMNNCT